MFAAGDRVVHPNHGAGVIEEIVERKTEAGLTKFFVFRMLVGSMRVLIPAESAEKIGLRPVICEEESDRLLCFLKDMPVSTDDNWNKRYRENLERMKSGDMEEVAYVVKSLAIRGRKRPLSTGERKIYNSASVIFVSEIAMAKHICFEDAEGLLNCILETFEDEE